MRQIYTKSLESLAVALVMAACVAAVLSGSKGHLTNHVPVGADSRLALCMLQWDIDAISQGKSWHELWQLPCLYPEPNMLANSDPLLGGAAIYAPLDWLTGKPILAFNLWIIVLVVLNFLSAYLVTRKLVGAVVPSLFCAVLFTVNYVRFAHLDHWHLWPNFPTPVLFLAAVRMSDGAGWRWPILGGLCLGIQFYMGMYLGYMAGIMVAILLATLAFYDPCLFLKPRFWGQLGVAGCLAALLLCPLAAPYHWAAHRWGGWIWELTQSQFPVWQNLFPQFGGEKTASAGFVAIVLFLAGACGIVMRLRSHNDRPAFWPVASVVLVAVLVAITLDHFGSYHLLYMVVPGFNALRCPARLTLLTVWPCGLVGAWALRYLFQSLWLHASLRMSVAAMGLIGLVFAENVQHCPWMNITLRDEEFYQTVVQHLPDGPYVDFPLNLNLIPPSNVVFGQRLQAERAAGWRPTLNLFSGKEPSWFRNLLERQIEASTKEQAASLLGELRLRGIRYVILHKNEMPKPRLNCWLLAHSSTGQQLGKVIHDDEDHLVLDLDSTEREARLSTAWAQCQGQGTVIKRGQGTVARLQNKSAGVIALRPCMPLRPGRYEAVFDLAVDYPAQGHCEVDRLEPETRPLPLILARCQTPEPGAHQQTVVEFTVPDERGPEPILEFRVVKTAAGTLWLNTVIVRPIELASMRGNAAIQVAAAATGLSCLP